MIKITLKKFLKPRSILISIIVLTAFLRLFRIDYPSSYMFDEVYHAYTAKEYLKGNREAWSPWGKSEPGVAFEWLHPPISKEIMTASMFILRTTDAWAWRLPSALLGILSVYLVYILGQLLFKNEATALISAFIFSIDGLVFVQSRIGMNDVYLVTFVLVSLFFFLKDKYLLSAVFLGISMATKWPGIYLLGVYIILLFLRKKFVKILLFIIIPVMIYLVSYTPYFLQGYRIPDFIELHKQIWWYQTNLQATHNYASPWWSWPLNLYPVWYFVDYKGDKIANIFASGNPIVFLLGAGAVILTIWEFLKKRTFSLGILLLGYFAFFLPWAASPRIMFLYHYSPSVPFLSLMLGYSLHKIYQRGDKKIFVFLMGLILLGFLFVFPFLTGIPIPKNLVEFFFLSNLTKNPF